MSLTVRKLQKSGFGLDTKFSSIFFAHGIMLAYTSKKEGPKASQICMTLIGKHSRSGDYVSENCREGEKKENVDTSKVAFKN